MMCCSMLSLLTPRQSDQVGGPIGSLREAKKVESYPNYATDSGRFSGFGMTESMQPEKRARVRKVYHTHGWPLAEGTREISGKLSVATLLRWIREAGWRIFMQVSLLRRHQNVIANLQRIFKRAIMIRRYRKWSYRRRLLRWHGRQVQLNKNIDRLTDGRARLFHGPGFGRWTAGLRAQYGLLWADTF